MNSEFMNSGGKDKTDFLLFCFRTDVFGARTDDTDRWVF